MPAPMLHMTRRWFGFTFALLIAAGASAATEQPALLDTPTGQLSGTLMLPDGTKGKLPVAVLIAGSGPTDRDGNSPLLVGKNDSLKMVAQALADAGVASLRYDKRGVAASKAAGPKEEDLRFDMYVDDAAAWAAKLAADPRFSSVTLIGHSEGSLIGMIAAQRGKAVGYVSLAGIGQPAGGVLRQQLAGKLPPALAARNEQLLSALEEGKTAVDVPPELNMLYRPSVQPYMISWLRWSPAVEIAKLKVPCLILQGDTDIQVHLADAEALAAANKRCSLGIVPGMNHVLKDVVADPKQQFASYSNPDLPLDKALVEALKKFFAAMPSR